MHLTADELVGPLREECSFLPSPGASLNQFASGTAKHLISLTDPQDKTEPVNYQKIKGNVLNHFLHELKRYSRKTGRN